MKKEQDIGNNNDILGRGLRVFNICGGKILNIKEEMRPQTHHLAKGKWADSKGAWKKVLRKILWEGHLSAQGQPQRTLHALEEKTSHGQ